MITPKRAHAFIAAITVIVASSALADNGRISQSPAEQWATACEGDARSKKTVGYIDKAESQHGLAVLHTGGFRQALERQSLTEACLSIVASSAIGIPTLVVDRPDDFKVFNLHDPDPNVYIESQESARSLGQNLKDLAIGYRFGPDDTEGKASVSDWRMANRVHRVALTQKARTTHRSYASPLKDHCVSISTSEPFSDWFKKQTVEIQKTAGHWITPSMQQWHKRYADAFEFWHEVAHCTQTPTYKETRDRINGRIQHAGAINPNETWRLTTTSDTQESCSTTADRNPDERTTSHKILLSTTENLQKIAEQQAAIDRANDATITIKLQQEHFADDFGMERIRRRFSLPTPGCTGKQTLNEWERSRILLNLSTPRPEYLTFLAPYLNGIEFDAQRHALADAWDALIEISDDFGTQNIASQLRPESANRYFMTPSFPPDHSRQNLWKTWLLQNLQPPGGHSPTGNE